jgi:hypothetical protein
VATFDPSSQNLAINAFLYLFEGSALPEELVSRRPGVLICDCALVLVEYEQGNIEAGISGSGSRRQAEASNVLNSIASIP